MSKPLGTFRIGEDVTIAIDAVTGNVADVASIQVKLAAGLPNRSTFEVDPGFTALTLTAAPRAAVGDFPAGWNVTLAAAQSSGLAEGLYGIDAKLTGLSGEIDITDSTAVILMTRGAVT